MKTEHFDHDPGWEGRNNRIIPKEYPTVVQAFGYSQTHFAGAAAGEMGGQVWRASEPAYYGDKIGPRTLDDKLSASGTFALTKTSPGSGVFFGFFRAEQPGAGGRPIGSLGPGSGLRTQRRSPGRPAHHRPEPIVRHVHHAVHPRQVPPHAAQERRHAIHLEARLRSERGRRPRTIHVHDPWRAPNRCWTSRTCRKPTSRKPAPIFRARRRSRSTCPRVTNSRARLRPLRPDEHDETRRATEHLLRRSPVRGPVPRLLAGSALGRFRQSGHAIKRPMSPAPTTSASARRTTPAASLARSAAPFGGLTTGATTRTRWGRFRLPTGSRPAAELSWWSVAPTRICASVGSAATTAAQAPNKAGNFLGIKVGGPTRVGHYFLPAFTINEQVRGLPDKGPVLRPGKTYEWSLVYDPAANDGQGAITATLGDESGHTQHQARPETQSPGGEIGSLRPILDRSRWPDREALSRRS